MANDRPRRRTTNPAAAPAVDVGCWFLVPESEIHLLDGCLSGHQFSAKPGHRPVVLARMQDAGDDSVLFPRSTRGGPWDASREFHSRHAHSRTDQSCRITRDGWVVVAASVTVASRHLSAATYSCKEPGGTGLMAAIERRLPS